MKDMEKWIRENGQTQVTVGYALDEFIVTTYHQGSRHLGQRTLFSVETKGATMRRAIETHGKRLQSLKALNKIKKGALA
jgi:hypothetical protein